MYVKGKMTVMLNVSGCILNTGIHNRARIPIVLHAKPEKGQVFVDIDKVCDPNVVDAYYHEFESWTEQGLVTWHPKGTTPKIKPITSPMILPQSEGEVRIAPPNIYDQKLNELQEKEEREDEKTKPQSTRRDLTRETPQREAPVTPPSPPPPAQGPAQPAAPGRPVAMHPAPGQTRTADAAKGEIDAGAGAAPTTRGADPTKGEVDGASVRPPPGTSKIIRATVPPGKYDQTLVGELFDAALASGVIVKEGRANFSFEGTKLAFGKTKAIKALDANAQLQARVRAAMNALGG